MVHMRAAVATRRQFLTVGGVALAGAVLSRGVAAEIIKGVSASSGTAAPTLPSPLGGGPTSKGITPPTPTPTASRAPRPPPPHPPRGRVNFQGHYPPPPPADGHAGNNTSHCHHPGASLSTEHG